MGVYNYLKIYPFEKSVFIEKLKSKTVDKPFNYVFEPLADKKSDRIFVLHLKSNFFSVYTYRINASYSFEITTSPMCIYGTIEEYNGQTTVRYCINKMEEIRKLSDFAKILGCSMGGVIILSLFQNGVAWGNLLLGVICTITLLRFSQWLMKRNVLETDILHQFMEELSI